MSATGVIVNGQVELDHQSAPLPDGTKVFIVKESVLTGTPYEPYILEHELRILRERIEDAKAGNVMTLEEVVAKLDAEFESPALAGNAK